MIRKASETIAPGAAAWTIVLAGGAAGLCDLVYASGQKLAKGGSPLAPWKGVASGLLGPQAREGGAEMALLGVALHFLIALGAAALLYLIVRRFRWFQRQPLITGVLYGAAFLVVMNYVILPLSAIGKPIYPLATIGESIFWHVVLVGLPTSLVIWLRLRRTA